MRAFSLDLRTRVLADYQAGLSFAELGRKFTTSAEWVPYSKACTGDSVIEGTAATLRILAKNYPIFYISARNVEALEETEAWLDENSIPRTEVRLRTHDDIDHNGEYKVAHIKLLRERGFNPILMFEDNQGVADMVRAIGIPVMLVNPGYDDVIGVNFIELASSL